jgi:inhibitor of growth protein 5
MNYPSYSLDFRKDISISSVSTLNLINNLDVVYEKCGRLLDEKIKSVSNEATIDESGMNTIKKMKNEMDSICTKKVDLAIKLYDFLDVNVKLIDADLTILEKALMDGSMTSNKEISSSSQQNALMSPEGIIKRKRGRPRLNQNLTQGTPLIFEFGKEDDQEDDLRGVPINNEPVYCTCKRVAFGEMIACDNEDCPIEWYHYPCVNLTKKPRNSWICPTCSNKRKR